MIKKYYEYKIENLIVVSKIITIHSFNFDKHFSFKGESHDFWEFVYVDKGYITISCGEKKCELKDGEIYFHKPNEFHALSCNGKSSPNVIIVSFSCKSNAMHFFDEKKIEVPENLKQYIYSVLEEGKKTFNIPYSDPNTKKMELLEDSALGGCQIIKNLLELFFIKLIRNQTHKSENNAVFLKKEDLHNTVANLTIKFLSENLGKKLCIEEISKQLNYTPSYIIRQFKKSTGTTIMKYYVILKVEKAKQLLRETNLSVERISETLAFESPNYFSKTFKKLTSLTPLQYKTRNT